MSAATDNDLPITVVFVNTDLRVGGQERALVEIVRGLDRTRIRPVVVCLKEPGELAPRVTEAGIALHTRLSSGRYDVRVLWRLLSILRRERADLVCTVGSGDKMFWGRLAGWLAGARTVSTIHKTRSADGRPAIERWNRWLTPITDRYVAVAAGAAEYLIREEGLPRAKLCVIHNGVDVARFASGDRGATRARLGLSKHDFAIVHVAVLRPEKGHGVLLDAAARVRAAVPNVRFLLVGEGPERAAIEARRDALGLGTALALLGQRSDLPDLLAASDAAVLTSHDRVETFPNCLLEAMAASLPVVATAVGSVGELVDDGVTGYLVASGDSHGLADRLIELAGDAERRRALGEAGRRRVSERFPLEKMVSARAELFLSLTGPRRTAG
ncbi:MAG: glycosyltransferase [Planctomycetota bacterium]